jgi:hypothetical protein
MKKLYTLLAGILFTSGFAFGQASQTAVLDSPQKIQMPELVRANMDVDFSGANDREVLWSDSFGDPSLWTIYDGDDGEQGEWVITTIQSENTAQFIGAMFSQTVDDGFAEFDGIQFLLSPDDVDVQDSYMEYNEPIDCSTLSEVVLSFNERYRAFNQDVTTVEVSGDGGTNWVSFEVNSDVVTNAPAIQAELSIDITAIAAGQSDVRIRFRWESNMNISNPDWTQQQENSFGSGYGWLLDDIQISGPIQTNLVIGTTWFDDWYVNEVDPSVSDADYLASVEMHTTPYYSVNPFNFACGVTNAGLAAQEVQLLVTFNHPEGGPAPEQILSDPITLEPGDSDTIRIEEFVPAGWTSDELFDHPGAYFIDYEVISENEDELPINNIGVSRIIRISSNLPGEGEVIMHSNSITINPQAGGGLPNMEEDCIHANRFVYSEYEAGDRVITAIEFALQDETLPESEIYLNIRKGSVLEAEGPDNDITPIYSYEEDDPEALIYETEADGSDLSATSTPVWVRFDLPEPLLIEANEIYQAEIFIPLFGEPTVRVGATTGRGPLRSVFLTVSVPNDAEDSPNGWYAWGTPQYAIRLVTASTVSTEDYVVDNGIEMLPNFPNPFAQSTTIQFKLQETSNTRLEVFDITGKLVYEQNYGTLAGGSVNMFEFNRNGLAPGIYTYSIVTDNGRLSRKMTIQ